MRKKLIKRVRPGVFETSAIGLRWLARALMSEDFPTFDLPMNANSGNSGSGQDARSGQLIWKVADWTFMWRVLGGDLILG